MQGHKIGYIRVSSFDQNPERQLDQVQLDRVFTDKASGKDAKRPALEALLTFVREGDTVVVHSMDRLARNLDDLRRLVQTLTKRGVQIQFVKEGLLFTGDDSPMATLLLSVMGAFAEFERALIRERQREGITLAKQRGAYRGRKASLSPAQQLAARQRVMAGDSKSAIAREFGISRQTLYQYLQQAEDNSDVSHNQPENDALLQPSDVSEDAGTLKSPTIILPQSQRDLPPAPFKTDDAVCGLPQQSLAASIASDSASRTQQFAALIDQVQSCTSCPRMGGRARVFGKGNGPPQSRVLFLAEAPGRLGADRFHLPLYGDQTGRNFERLLKAAGLTRDDIFISNAVLCNPRDEAGNNAVPAKVELHNCSHHLRATLTLLQPRYVVTLGKVALAALHLIAPHTVDLAQDVGRPTAWNATTLIPLYHPGPRACIHRSLEQQFRDYEAVGQVIRDSLRELAFSC